MSRRPLPSRSPSQRGESVTVLSILVIGALVATAVLLLLYAVYSLLPPDVVGGPGTMDVIRIAITWFLGGSLAFVAIYLLLKVLLD